MKRLCPCQVLSVCITTQILGGTAETDEMFSGNLSLLTSPAFTCFFFGGGGGMGRVSYDFIPLRFSGS